MGKENGRKEKRVETFSVIEQCPSDCASDRRVYLTKIVAEFQDHLTKRANHCLGYPVNQDCGHYVDLAPLLGFHINNVGDPFTESTLALHSRNFELGVLEWFAQLWEIDNDEFWGYVTNGGSESNLHGLLIGRELLPDGILYASKDSHYSVFKAARMYRMDCKTITALATGEVDCLDLKAKLLLNKNRPAIINVNIGTAFKGGVDDLNLIIQTLEECGFSPDQFYIHCDAALSGLIMPFLKQASICSFKKPIGSMSVSGHKFLGSPTPCGVLMTRKRYIDVSCTNNIEYVATLDTTISGSRNGHASMFMWYGLSIKGHIGIQQDVIKCLRNAQYLRDRLKTLGISSMLNAMSITVVFERPPDYDFIRHWQLSYFKNMVHVVVMPHVTVRMMDDFLDDLVEKRKKWYEFGKMQSICLAEDIGASNCACSVHGKEFVTRN